MMQVGLNTAIHDEILASATHFLSKIHGNTGFCQEASLKFRKSLKD